MLFAIYCRDKKDHQQTRLDNRPAHVEYLKKFTGQHAITGPLLTDDGQGMAATVGMTVTVGMTATVRMSPWA